MRLACSLCVCLTMMQVYKFLKKQLRLKDTDALVRLVSVWMPIAFVG